MKEANYRLLQYLAAAAVGAVIVAPQIVQVMQKRPTLSGTNHIPALSAASTLEKGDIVCQPGQVIPLKTGAISAGVEITGGRTARLEMSVRRKNRVEQTQRAATQSGEIKFPFKITRSEAVSSVCLRALDEKVAVVGTGLPYPNLPMSDKLEATFNGKEDNNLIALKFWEKKNKSVIQQINSMTKRASLFRPSLIGGWFYWLLMIAVICAWVMAIKVLVAQREEDDK